MEQTDKLAVNTGPRKVFSRIGIACVVILAISAVLQVVGDLLVYRLFPIWREKSWYIWAITYVPMYLIGVPIGALLLYKIPSERSRQRRLGAGTFMMFFIMCIGIMIVGNVIGTLLSMAIGAISGTENVNPVNSLIMDANIYMTILVVVILAPLIEELIFRKLIIDRIRVFGEGTAILVSGLMFGLFHGNLYQFFYAFGLGAMFAYIYIRTGRLRYCVALHMIINFMGGILAPMLLKSVDLDSLAGLDTADAEVMMRYFSNNAVQLMGYGLYMFAMFAAAVAGLVLLIVKRRAFVLTPAPYQLKKGAVFKTVFLNIGMILFAVTTLAIFVFVLM